MIETKILDKGAHEVESIALEMRVTTTDHVVMIPMRVTKMKGEDMKDGKDGIAVAMDAEQMGFIMHFMARALPAIMAGLAKHAGVDSDILATLKEAARATKQ